ncbi:MAG TPA: hypothetical protein VN685_05925, partial [Rhizomicrobium sp.]|nr:hypothetical protein [Rhizomicrobium sp.]
MGVRLGRISLSQISEPVRPQPWHRIATANIRFLCRLLNGNPPIGPTFCPTMRRKLGTPAVREKWGVARPLPCGFRAAVPGNFTRPTKRWGVESVTLGRSHGGRFTMASGFRNPEGRKANYLSKICEARRSIDGVTDPGLRSRLEQTIAGYQQLIRRLEEERARKSFSAGSRR